MNGNNELGALDEALIIPEPKSVHGIVINVTGPTAAGKSRIMRALQALLKNQGISYQNVSEDPRSNSEKWVNKQASKAQVTINEWS